MASPRLTLMFGAILLGLVPYISSRTGNYVAAQHTLSHTDVSELLRIYSHYDWLIRTIGSIVYVSLLLFHSKENQLSQTREHCVTKLN